MVEELLRELEKRGFKISKHFETNPETQPGWLMHQINAEIHLDMNKYKGSKVPGTLAFIDLTNFTDKLIEKFHKRNPHLYADANPTFTSWNEPNSSMRIFIYRRSKLPR